jgi:hypothetical protein
MRKRNLLLLTVMAVFLTQCTKKDVSGSTAKGASINQTGSFSTLASPAGDVVGKVVVGYQGWFACAGDGSPFGTWWHWPAAVNNTYKGWPDMRQFTTSYQSVYGPLNNGQASKLFSDWDQSTVTTHFQWMQQNGIDAAALQRFDPNGSEGAIRDGVAAKVKSAAEATGRKFYIMYDVTSWTAMETEIKTDWTNKMSAYTSSTAYAKQNGKPVVCIWGFGFNDDKHVFTAAACLDVVNWFKSQGCYVIGGVPREWRTGVNGSRASFLGVYHAFNMLSPWLIGAVGNVSDADNIYTNYMVPDQADCNTNGIDYQPCVLPGDLSSAQRSHGNLMWEMFYNAKKLGVQGLYVSMFDEYGEGNQIAASTENSQAVPAGSSIPSLNEDGTACTADYYLRLTGDGTKMFKGTIALTATRPTPTTFTPPSSLTPHVLSSTSIQINWAQVTDAPCYNVKRAITSGGPYTMVASGVTGGTYTNTGLSTGTTYYYVITSGHFNGSESANSAQVSAAP